jgi:lipopolysaccharide export system protein LptC
VSVAPLPLPRASQPPRPQRTIGTATRRPPTRLGRRHIAVGLAKRLLPVVALALLSMVALWPEYRHEQESLLAYRVRGIEPANGQLSDLRYSGVDDRNRPYMLTAAAAHQFSSERIDLVEPKGDISLESGNWLMVQSHQGVYMQHTSLLDLSGDVVLYRDDGLTMTTDVATLDLKAGAATSAERVHAEGPFGSLDAQGFSLTDRGAVVQFAGPGRLVLNGNRR